MCEIRVVMALVPLVGRAWCAGMLLVVPSFRMQFPLIGRLFLSVRSVTSLVFLNCMRLVPSSGPGGVHW